MSIYKHVIKKTTLLFAILIVICWTSVAQDDFRPGFYITLKNDTVYGLIDYRSEIRNSKYCSFKTDLKSKEIRFEPKEIKAYQFKDGKYYISKEMNIDGIVQTIFLEFLVDGIANLYYHKTPIDFYYYVEDRDGNLLELSEEDKEVYIEGKGYYKQKEKRYIGALKASFSDCPEVHSSIDKSHLTHKSLISISKEYHHLVCEEEECIVYGKRLPTIKFRFSPSVGLAISKFEIKDGFFSDFAFDNSFSPSVGIVMNTSLPRVNEKLSLEIESNIYKNDFYCFHEKEQYISKKYDLWLDFISLQTSVGLKYTYPRGTLRPNVLIGGMFTSSFNSHSELRREEIIDNKVETYNQIGPEAPEIMWGPTIQIGCDFTVKHKYVMYTSFKFSKNTSEEADIRTELQTLTISLGIKL